MDELDFYTKTEINAMFDVETTEDTGRDFYTKAEIIAKVGTPETPVLPADMLDFYTKSEVDSIPIGAIPPLNFTSSTSTAVDYRIYGALPAGQIVLSVRTPRTKNLLPYPYPGFYYHSASGSERWQKSDNANFTFTDNGNGTYDVPAQTAQNWKTMFQFCGSPHYDEHPGILIPPGSYTLSFRDDNAAMPDQWPQLEVYSIGANSGTERLNLTDLIGNPRHTGRIVFTINNAESCYIHARLYFQQNMPINAHTIAPQLEAGTSITAYEPPNPATLTTITLPRALEEGEYLSFADQKIMPTGTPITLPALQTLVGENVFMIENYPYATNTVYLRIE